MNEPQTTRLASLFVDHAVLQQGRPVSIWGWDQPGQTVSVRLCDPGTSRATAQAQGRSDARGRFRVALPALPDGGPYDLIVEGSRRVLSKDVWLGEVWLASGQSNMEWKVASSRDAAEEIEAASWPQIRMFKVAPCAARAPAEEALGSWAVCSPETAADFSAVAYFFARALHEARAVAIGVIDATWGGTCIEAWTSLEALAPVLPDLAEQQRSIEAQLADLPRIQASYAASLAEWQRRSLPRDEGNQGLERGWADAAFDASAWPTMTLPSFWQAHGMSFNGAVWFRREVQIPEELADQRLTLSLGAVDDFDDTYFDGRPAGSTPPGTVNAHQLRRRYEIPASSAGRGRHVIAVRVFDHFGNGGFAGPQREMYLAQADGRGERLPLSGPWQYQVEREIPLVPLSVFATLPAPPLALALQNAPATLFHGMIAPLIGCALRGAIWYQGESNTARHASYRALQVALMRDWRTRFAQGHFPFYYVQLANYRASADWPLLREAQAQALSEPETGMVVAIDVGEADDIHPKNKQEVGRRLSLLARARAYGEADLVCEGPRMSRVEIRGAEVRVKFDNARGLRSADERPLRGFFVAGPDGSFEPARARIAGPEVWLDCDRVSAPCAVRYAWADQPDANLENGAALPAAPFRTDGFGASSHAPISADSKA